MQVLIGQGIMPKAASPLTETVGQEALASFMSGMKMAMDKAVTAMPSHDAFIARHCAATTV